MSFGLRWGEDTEDGGGFIWFDAVTANVESYRGQVTKHPIASGGSISDHFIRENPVITLAVVITGFDISENSYSIEDSNRNLPYNVSPAPSTVKVNSTDQSVLTKFIPDSIGQFLSDQTPEVIVDGAKNETLANVKDFMTDLMSGVIYNDKKGKFVPNIQTVKLYEYTETLLNKIINNLVITNMVFREDTNTGEGLFCDLTFEQVTFVALKKTSIPKDVSDSLKKKASTKASKGKQGSEVNSVEQDKKPTVDPKRAAEAELKKG